MEIVTFRYIFRIITRNKMQFNLKFNLDEFNLNMTALNLLRGQVDNMLINLQNQSQIQIEKIKIEANAKKNGLPQEILYENNIP